ncbi:MAG: zinc ribbon domain-containing protein [Candidatus Thorarchaeota archaeon]
MTEKSNGGILLGIILVVFPIMALVFGSDEPAMQTDQAALVMTAMIVIGIITIVNSKAKQESTPTAYAAVPQPVVPQSPAYCPQCGAPITLSDARFCPKCGRSLPD